MTGCYEDLADRIGAKRYTMVVTILNKIEDLNLLYDDGTFFNMAISNGSVDILKSLLDYFYTKQLCRYNDTSTEYLLLKSKIVDILESATEDIELSEGIKEVLSSYLGLSNQNNLSIITEASNEDGSSAQYHKSQSIKDTKFPYLLLVNKIKSKLISICFDDSTDSNDKVGIFSTAKKNYKHPFKTEIQNLLKVQEVKEVMNFLDNLKYSLSLERTPSIPTLYRWKKDINAKELGDSNLAYKKLQELLTSYDGYKLIDLDSTDLLGDEYYIKQQNNIEIVGGNAFDVEL